MESDENNNKLPVYDFCDNSNSLPSEQTSEGSIISYLQFQRPETPPEYRDENGKNMVEVVSLIANAQNPSKSDVEVPEPSSELPSSSPGTEECRQQGDEMDIQQSDEEVDVDIRLLSDDNIPESQQPSKEHAAELLSSVETDTTQFLTGDTTSEAQGSNLENNTKLQHPIEVNKADIKVSNRRDINESQKGESATELQTGDDLLGLQHTVNEIPPELQYKREEDLTDMSALRNRDNEERIELKPPMEGNNNEVICSIEENAELKQTIVEIQNPRGEDNIEMEYSSEDKTTKLQLPKKENITEIEQMKEDNITDLTHPREESLITDMRHPGEEGTTSETQSSNEEKIFKLEVKDETLGLEHSDLGAISEVDHAMEDSEAPILGSDSELEHRMEGNATEMPDSIDIADNKTESQSILKDESEPQADGVEESQLSEVKMESGSPKGIDIDPQHTLSEDNPLSSQTDHEGTTDEQDVRETQEAQLNIAQGQEPEKTELDTSEMVHQSTALTDKPLEYSDAVTFSEVTKDSDFSKPPTSSPKPEPEQKKLVEDLKGKEKQSNASSLEPETKPDQLVIPAPVIAHSVVMQEHMSNEEYRSWKEVLESPEDFEAWVKLLALAEKHESPVVIRETFDRFLKLYPYCYGYWRKFADLVLRLQGWPQAQQILEIGVYSIPLSIDLWLHYAALSFNQGIDYTAITALYDRSLEIAGYEYRSDLLWEAAIHYQESQNQMVKVFTLLRQLIATPTQHFKKHFHKYETFLNTRPISELLSAEEFKTIGEQTKFTRLANDSAKSLDEKVGDCLLDQGRQVHGATEEEIGLRQPFEEKIKRPYFHVQPLEDTQLQTWRAYLDFEIARKYKDRIVFLFERCMIVCALYEEMWIKYAKFLGTEYSEEARAVFQRGVCYIPKSVAIHLEWSLFEESLGQLERARELLHTIDQKIPDLIETRCRYVAFELRHGCKDKVDELYKQSVSQSQKQFQKNPSHSQNNRLLHDVYNYWVTKYVFFLHRHRNEHAVAKKMLFDAIEKDKNNSTLYFYLVDLEMNQQPIDKDKVMSVLNKAIHAPLAQEVKEIFSLRKLHWAEEMGISLDYKVMNELKNLREKSYSSPSAPSTHALRKRPNEYESDSYAKHSRVDSSTYASDQGQHNTTNYQQSGEPNQQNYPPYYQASQSGYQYNRGEMGESNQQWSQQYNYQQDWGYQQYQHQ